MLLPSRGGAEQSMFYFFCLKSVCWFVSLVSPSSQCGRPSLHFLLMLQTGAQWDAHSGCSPQTRQRERGGLALHWSVGPNFPVSTMGASVEQRGGDIAEVHRGGLGDVEERRLGHPGVRSSARFQPALRWGHKKYSSHSEGNVSFQERHKSMMWWDGRCVFVCKMMGSLFNGVISACCVNL